jgi:hypothetical protein
MNVEELDEANSERHASNSFDADEDRESWLLTLDEAFATCFE